MGLAWCGMGWSSVCVPAWGASDGALEVGVSLLEVRDGLDVLDVDRLDRPHAVDEGEEICLARLVSDLGCLKGLLGLGNVRRGEEPVLFERRAGAQERLFHVAPKGILDASAV